MSVSPRPDLARICPLLRAASRAEILPRFRRAASRAKDDGSPVTDADLAMQRRVGEALRQLAPEIPMLGEEMPAAEQGALLLEAASGLWCLDPLDGTTNFAAGFPFFSVSLALIQQGVSVLGAVYDPIRDECFTAERGRGCWLNGIPLRLVGSRKRLGESLALVDRKRLGPEQARRLSSRSPYRSERSLGSVALEWCWLAAGRCQIYLHGGQKLWDYAAGTLILEEAGGASCLLEIDEGAGGSIDLRSRIAVAAETRELLEEWRRWLGL